MDKHIFVRPALQITKLQTHNNVHFPIIQSPQSQLKNNVYFNYFILQEGIRGINEKYVPDKIKTYTTRSQKSLSQKRLNQRVSKELQTPIDLNPYFNIQKPLSTKSVKDQGFLPKRALVYPIKQQQIEIKKLINFSKQRKEKPKSKRPSTDYDYWSNKSFHEDDISDYVNSII
ncbi:hypothetical protein pb186bvf_015871 [Paramecium bursaria]